MRHSKCEMYVHIVWTTWRRAPFLTPEVERAIYRCVQSEAKRLHCTVLALGGTSDHIHLLLKIPATISLSVLVQRLKGGSSHFVTHELKINQPFRWQEGYGVFSVSRNHVEPVIKYIRAQKVRHQTGMLWREWEEADEERRDEVEGTIRARAMTSGASEV